MLNEDFHILMKKTFYLVVLFIQKKKIRPPCFVFISFLLTFILPNMASVVGKVFCVKCNKEKVAYKCEGCSQMYCLIHLNEHHQLLIQQLDQTDDKRNLFQQTILEQMANLKNHTLIEQVNQWEKNSIQSIQQAADRARELIIKRIEEHYRQVKVELDKLTEQLKQIRQDEDFNEIHLNELKAKLEILEKGLNQSANISIEKDPSLAFLNKNITDFISPSIRKYT